MKEKDFNQPILKTFISYFRPHIGLFILDLGCALIASLIDPTFPLVARHAMYNMLPNNEAYYHLRVRSAAYGCLE